MTNPLQQFSEDRRRAFAQEDPMAALCTVANADADGLVHARTLVLRELNGQLALFVNATSPKWQHLQEPFVVHTYWPSVQVQYRLRVNAAEADRKAVHDSWLQRPPPPQKMDWFYAQMASQSSTIESREALLAQLDDVDVPEPLRAPDNARGLVLSPLELERLDLTQANGVHDRRRYQLIDGVWRHVVLVP